MSGPSNINDLTLEEGVPDLPYLSQITDLSIELMERDPKRYWELLCYFSGTESHITSGVLSGKLNETPYHSLAANTYSIHPLIFVRKTTQSSILGLYSRPQTRPQDLDLCVKSEQCTNQQCSSFGGKHTESPSAVRRPLTDPRVFVLP